MQTPEFRENLDTLMELAKSERIAIMCAEAVPWRCHSRCAVGTGIEVREITSATRLQLHTLTRWGKVNGMRVTYPAEHRARLAHAFIGGGDYVEWNSEAGRVRRTIKEKYISEITFKGYTVYASREEPQYFD